jgi:hypothetical protein
MERALDLEERNRELNDEANDQWPTKYFMLGLGCLTDVEAGGGYIEHGR